MLPDKLGGGPHGVGDPDDKSFRKVEREILIPQKVRDKARDEKCALEGEAFTKCCVATKFFMVWKCKPETKALTTCLERWYRDEGLIKECEEEYLRERSEYRITGIPKKFRRKESTMM